MLKTSQLMLQINGKIKKCSDFAKEMSLRLLVGNLESIPKNVCYRENQS